MKCKFYEYDFTKKCDLEGQYDLLKVKMLEYLHL